MYKKHHPPSLEDEVWRLEKIGKDGAFHKKLSSFGINTVQDFLKLSIVDPSKLRKVQLILLILIFVALIYLVVEEGIKQEVNKILIIYVNLNLTDIRCGNV